MKKVVSFITAMVVALSGLQMFPIPASAAEKTASNILVAYFSCTGNTETIAGYVAEQLGADMYNIEPKVSYTSADLDYNSNCRANREQDDSKARPEISGKVDNMDKYSVVFIGYPIWWGQAPKIMYTFLESYDFSGKTIVPFCTSGSSGIGGSAKNMQSSAKDANWLDGKRFSGSDSKSSVKSWTDSLCLIESTVQKATLSRNGKISYKCSLCGKTVKPDEIIYYPKKVKLSKKTYKYDGKVKNPTIIVKDSRGEVIPPEYYTVKKPSGRKNAGKYTYKITFRGNYSGTKSLTLTIEP